MLSRPRFKSCYSVSTIAPDQVLLLSERGSVCLQDQFLYLVASLVDGDRTNDEIIDKIQWQLLSTIQDNATLFQEVLNISLKIQAALFQLEREGYLVENENILPENLLVFCEHLNIQPKLANERLKTTKIAVRSFDCPGTEALINNLKSLNIQVVKETDSPDLTIVLIDDYLNPNLKEFNQQALQSQTPWLLVKPVGTIFWMGPIFKTQETACWQCLAHRLQDNRPMASFIQRQNQDLFAPISPQSLLPSSLETALGMVATEVFKWIIQKKNSQLNQTLITYDTLTFKSQEHFVIKRPQCPSCGQMSHELMQKPVPVVLGHRPKTFTTDGGHRICSPQETLRKYQHFISPITGVVRELIKIPLNPLNHTYIAKHHFVTIFDDLENLHKNLGGKSSGKGRTDIQARASGFCEAIERYSGVFQGNEIRIKNSYQKMGDRAIHPNHCMNFSQQQYDSRIEWNTNCHGWFQKVPEPFDQEREIDWTPVWSLTAGDFKYLPTAYCYYGYPQRDYLDCWADSNGCAAGNTIEEAILQGFMELVERDSIALWWYNRLSKPQVNLNSFNDPYVQNLREYYQELGRELWVLDITNDLNIPSFAAISAKKDSSVEDIILGYGTHFDVNIALSRALTELNQILPSVLAANPDGTTNYPQYVDPLALTWWKEAKLSDHSYLIPDSHLKAKNQTDYAQFFSNDLLDDVKLCQKIVEEKNMEMLVLDQTRPDIGLKVAKVIVPGLRHLWKRLGAGRLYDVSLKMGWLSESLTENQLNPFPMWM
ncbi:TOMM precursor leader peptide-binding protein [Dolichospermum sp. FACHB-1091]|nr:TOMM precursor leader peptide-binding protein [Dolichospermum sp. FACHB-1091]MBD2444325.1 TOMM precursor leader peptide-binding protein [Dolichospermum sp. FACHB-1091]